jgi:hypothetical protein
MGKPVFLISFEINSLILPSKKLITETMDVDIGILENYLLDNFEGLLEFIPTDNTRSRVVLSRYHAEFILGRFKCSGRI